MPAAKKKPKNHFRLAAKKLFALGRKQGFLTQDLILQKFPQPHKYIDQLDLFAINFFQRTLIFLRGLTKMKSGKQRLNPKEQGRF